MALKLTEVLKQRQSAQPHFPAHNSEGAECLLRKTKDSG